jgi:4-amino-4-deoxy-L-arabinose transferase-like glycosyltransferase
MKQYLIVALLAVAAVVPFSSRAVFLDEHIFLKIAANAQHNWEFPQDTPSVFFGVPLANYAAHTHPPVGEYYLALIYRLLGRFSEVPFRLLFSIFSVIAACAFLFLARRFTAEPLWVTALFVCSPAFFVMAPTLMMDIPMLAFLLAGLAFYFRHLESGKHALLWASLCFVLAMGTGYTALVPLGCLFLSLLLGRRPWKELFAVMLAPVTVGLWQLAMTLHFGAFPLAKTVAYYTGQPRPLHNIAATLSFIGGVGLFPWTTLVLQRNLRKIHVMTALALGVIPALWVPAASWGARLWYFVLATSGILLLLWFVESARGLMASEKNAGEAVFILWVPATLLFFIVVADMINARYVLLTLPALYLVVLRRSTVRQLATVLVPTLLLSLSLAYADFVFVNGYRDWVAKTVVPLQQDGFTVWSAAESGLRFYLEQEGMLTLAAGDLRPKGMDLVVSQDLFRYGLNPDLATMLTTLTRVPMTSAFPLRTFNAAAGAGFHDSGIGPTPFAISTAPLDFLEIAQVSPFVDHLPQTGIPAEQVPAWSPKGPILKQNADVREFKLRIPANSKLEYELVGSGAAEITPDGLRLKRLSPDTIVWQRFRIVPAQLAQQGY